MKNWKTTLAGLFLAFPSLLVGTGAVSGTNKYIAIAQTIGAIFLGLTAKDSNVTGGTVGQDDKEGKVLTPAVRP